jgi:hypothetical protein
MGRPDFRHHKECNDEKIIEQNRGSSHIGIVFVHADTVAHKFGRGLAGMTCGFFRVARQLRQGNRIGIDLLRGSMTSKNPP